MFADQPKHLIYLELIKKLLQNPFEYDWSYQGLGMLRLYLGDVARLHIWDQRLAVPGVSRLHSHSWSLRSTVISGEITNQRYRYHYDRHVDLGFQRPFMRQRIVCGFNSELAAQAERVMLIHCALEVYFPGQVYQQKADEVHDTTAKPGTITIMERKFDGPNEEADVFYAEGGQFVSAKPRKATTEEIILFMESAKALLCQKATEGSAS